MASPLVVLGVSVAFAAALLFAGASHWAMEKAYARSDLFDARRELMQAWADHLTGVAKPASEAPVEPAVEAAE